MISNLGQNLVFLLSLPRSGSTLLSALLNQLPDVYCPPEPWLALKAASIVSPGNASNIWNEQVATKAVSEFFAGEFPTSPLRAFLASAYNEKLSPTVKSCFVDKTPRYYHILDKLEVLFPKARFIWLVRHPLDVAVSYRQTWNINVDVLTGKIFRPESYDFLKGWPRLAADFAPPSHRRFHLRYEDLVADPTQCLANLAKFLEVRSTDVDITTFRPETLHQFAHASVGDLKILQTHEVHGRSVGQWAKELSDDELTELVSILGLASLEAHHYHDIRPELQRRHLPFPDEDQVVALREERLAQTWDEVADLRSRLATAEEHGAKL